MSRTYNFYRDKRESDEEEEWYQRYLEEERQYYLEQEHLMNDEELPIRTNEISHTEADLFTDDEENEEILDDDTAFE